MHRKGMVRGPLALGLALVLASRQAQAEDEIVRGSVVKVEAAEIYVNLGKDRAVIDGAPIRIKRAIKLSHPVTRQPVEDWIPIGSAVVTQAGGQLSRAVVGALIDEIKVGDVAEVFIDRPDKATPGPTPVPVPQPPNAPPVDPATTAVLTAFAQQVGQGIDARIATWESFLSKHPESPHAVAIRRDVEVLVALRDQMRPRTGPDTNQVAVTLGHTAPTRARVGAAVPLVFVLDQPDTVAAAYLHYRVASDRTYRRVLLTREHDIYLRGVIPVAAIAAPGVDYFIEVSTPTGASGLALGTPSAPVHVDVKAASAISDRFGPAPGRSAVRITGEYLDFATFEPRSGTRTDSVVTANVDFTYRIDRLIQSIGVGYGVLVGRGGFADREFTSMDPVPKSAFQFGYADLELALADKGVRVSAGGKLIAGVGRDGFGLGVEGRLRIGNRDAANLQLIANTIEQFGFVTDIKFGARPASDLGFAVSVGATDQPNNGDVAVKLGTEVEYFASPNISLLLRGSWQGRTTQHGGIGGGAGVGFTW
jgi:hypothetical protein